MSRTSEPGPARSSRRSGFAAISVLSRPAPRSTTGARIRLDLGHGEIGRQSVSACRQRDRAAAPCLGRGDGVGDLLLVRRSGLGIHGKLRGRVVGLGGHAEAARLAPAVSAARAVMHPHRVVARRVTLGQLRFDLVGRFFHHAHGQGPILTSLNDHQRFTIRQRQRLAEDANRAVHVAGPLLPRPDPEHHRGVEPCRIPVAVRIPRPQQHHRPRHRPGGPVRHGVDSRRHHDLRGLPPCAVRAGRTSCPPPRGRKSAPSNPLPRTAIVSSGNVMSVWNPMAGAPASIPSRHSGRPAPPGC